MKNLTFQEKLALAKEEAKAIRMSVEQPTEPELESKASSVTESKPKELSKKELTFKERLELGKKEVAENMSTQVDLDLQEQFEAENYNAIQRNVTRPLLGGINSLGNGIANTLEAYGGVGDETLRAIIPDAPENYTSSASSFSNRGGDGFRWRHLPAATVEALPSMAGTAASTRLGTALGGPVAGFAAGTGFNAMAQAGNIAKARAAAYGRTELTAGDRLAGVGTAAVSGALETTPFASGMGGLGQRMMLEGATEGLQSGIEQAGTTIDTKQGLTVDPKQMVGDGIIGATAGAGVRPVIDATANGISKIPEKISDSKQATSDYIDSLLEKLNSQTDADKRTVDEYDVILSKMFKREGASKTFNNPYGPSSPDNALGTLDAVEKRLKTQVSHYAKALNKLSKGQDDIKLEIAELKKIGGERTGAINDNSFNTLDRYFGDDPTYTSFKDSVIMNKRVAVLRDQNNLTGGIGGAIDKTLSGLPVIGNKFTPLRNAGDTSARQMITDTGMAAAIGAVTGGLSITGLAAVPLAKMAISKIDKATNRQSNPKLWLDTVDEAQKLSRVLPKSQLSQEVLEAAAAVKAERDARNTTPDGKVQISPLTIAANKQMFETGKIPETDYHIPYTHWQQAIGKNPKEILSTMMEMEQSGELPQGISERFQGNIRSFPTKGKSKANETYDIQELIRQRINPEYSALKARVEESKKNPERALKKLDPTKTGLNTDRKKQKAKEGARRAQNVLVDIEAGKATLDAAKYATLHKLKEAIDRPDMTAIEREQLVDDTLGQIFDTPVELSHWKKVFAPLTAIGNDYKIEREQQVMFDPNQLTLPFSPDQLFQKLQK